MKHSLQSCRIVILILFFIVGAAGCADQFTSTPRVSPVTPKAYIDGNNIQDPSEAIASQDNPGLLPGWSQAEHAAASFIYTANIYFYFDSYTLTEDAKKVLRQKAQKIKSFPTLKIIISGHCDERGTEEYNLALGERRARAAYNFLRQLGVPASQLEFVSYGKLHPTVHGSGESVWSKNRRDEFKVIKIY